jgi:hypothetical protein
MDEENTPWIPAVNTYILPETVPNGVVTPSFDHASRLADKLFGGVELAIDNVLFDQRLTEAKNTRTYQQVTGQSSLLPQDISSWVSRNSGIISTLTILGVIFFIGTMLGRR